MKESQVNILVIRSATRILNQTLLSLREEFPDSRITVLAPQSAREAVAQDPLVDEVLTLPDQRRMSVSSYGKPNIARLQEKKFDLAVSLYNIDHGLGYANIDRLAFATKAKEVRGYNPKGTFVKLDSAKVTRKSIQEKTTFFWLGINYVATAFLFLIITFALIGEWGVRKLLGKKIVSPKPYQSPKQQSNKVVTHA
tara:strand:- start:343 stop:930 length:588 start_codon:yes stop_codon:yes gene_type:complete